MFLHLCYINKWIKEPSSIMKRREKCTRFWWESQKERDHLEDLCIDGRMGSEWIFGTLAGGGGECRVDSVA
jgi:hypothetical protein